MHIPAFLNEYRNARKLAELPLVAAVAVASIWVWSWAGVLILVFLLLLWLIIRLFGEVNAQAEVISDREAEVEDGVALQLALAEVEAERDALQQQTNEPSLSLAHFLHALDDQAERLQQVAKHRGMARDGLDLLIVAAISSPEGGRLRCKMHPPERAELLYGELGVLIFQSTEEVIGAGPISQAIGTLELDLAISQETADAVCELEPHEFIVRPAGMVMTPYNTHLSDSELRDIEGSIRSLADQIASALRELEEDEQDD